MKVCCLLVLFLVFEWGTGGGVIDYSTRREIAYAHFEVRHGVCFRAFSVPTILAHIEGSR